MAFGYSVDSMYAFWDVGEEDLAITFAEMEGFVIAPWAGGRAQPFKRADGRWECRIVYANGIKIRDAKRYAAKKLETRA